MSKRLNVPCPYCSKQCRIGMSHECEDAPEGSKEVEITVVDGKIIALVLGEEE